MGIQLPPPKKMHMSIVAKWSPISATAELFGSPHIVDNCWYRKWHDCQSMENGYENVAHDHSNSEWNLTGSQWSYCRQWRKYVENIGGTSAGFDKFLLMGLK